MVLDDIVRSKKAEVEEQKKYISAEKLRAGLSGLKRNPRGFREALETGSGVHLIAEIKKASPSMGIIAPDFNARQIAKTYDEAGVSAISVLTETTFFMGRPSDIRMVRDMTHCPLLRKDFLIDEYQIAESVALGADAVLLIAALLDDINLRLFMKRAKEVSIETLVEVHDETELARALDAGAELIGINNRNLKTMEVDTKTTERLIKKIPKHVTVVAESGIETHDEIARLRKLGCHAFLVGTSILRSGDRAKKIAELKGEVR